jgi:hypothetical protein
VASYTITITSNDEAAAQTTIRVDTASGSARIIELTVRAAEGGGIFPQQLPSLNLDQLIAALVPSAPTAITETPGPSGDVSTGQPPTGQSSTGQSSTEQSSTEQSSTEQPSTEQSSTEQASARTDVPASEVSDEPAETPQPASSARGGRSSRVRKAARTAPAKKAPARSRQTKAEKAAAMQPTNGRRAYRRMPEAAELLAAYREVGGTTALARHYGVPRHTATGWLRRLRMQGMLES